MLRIFVKRESEIIAEFEKRIKHEPLAHKTDSKRYRQKNAKQVKHDTRRMHVGCAHRPKVYIKVSQ